MGTYLMAVCTACKVLRRRLIAATGMFGAELKGHASVRLEGFSHIRV